MPALPASGQRGWLWPTGWRPLVGPDTAAGRRRYVERLEGIARQESRAQCGVPPPPGDGRRSHLRRGWYWGSQAFAEKLLGLLDASEPAPRNRTYASAPQHQAHSQQQAEALLADRLRAQRLSPGQLARLPGNDPRKIALARELWTTATVSQGWIAEKLAMKSAANVSQILRRQKAARHVKIC